MQEPQLPLRRIALSCLGSIGKHDHTLADLLQKEGVIDHGLALLSHKDMLIRRQACRLLALSIQHHDGAVDWITRPAREALVETMKAADGTDGETGQFAATLVQQLAKRSNSAAAQLRELGVVPLLVNHIAAAAAAPNAASPMAAAAALGHICDAVTDAADAAVEHGAIGALKGVLSSPDVRPHVCAVLCSAVAAIANAGDSHSATVARSGTLQAMADATLLSGRKMGPIALGLARNGLSKAIAKCGDYHVLVGLMEKMPFGAGSGGGGGGGGEGGSGGGGEGGAAGGGEGEVAVLTALFKALARLMSEKGSLRLNFMQRGALTLAQQAKHSRSADLKEGLKALNSTYPNQMVLATDNSYEKQLLDKIV